MKEAESKRELRRRLTDKREERHNRALHEDIARLINGEAREAMADSKLVWYLGFCEPGKEFIAQQVLDRHDIRAYLPLALKWRKVNRYKKAKKRFAFPAMPGCVFLALESGAEQWFHLFSCQTTVKRVLAVRGVPRAIHGQELLGFIDGNRKTFSAPREQAHMRSHHEFTVGDKVQIMDGALDGHVVEVSDIRGRQATIVAELFGSAHNAII